jgi:hypothetical protein
MSKQSIDKYIEELTHMQAFGGTSLLLGLTGIDDSSKYYDVYLTDAGLCFITDNHNDDRSNVTTSRPRNSIKLGRITTVKEYENFDGSEAQRKGREEIRDILRTLENVGVVA